MMQISDFYFGIVLTINLLHVHILFHFLVTTPIKLSTAHSCPPIYNPAFGKASCLSETHVRKCTASCQPGFYFERIKNVNSITLKCHGDSWEPLQKFPECKPGPRCALKVRGKGYFHCTSDADGVHCDVTCDGDFKGQYDCNLRHWKPSLPDCVIPAAEKTMALCVDPGIPKGVLRRHSDGAAADFSRSFEEGESLRFLCDKKKNTLHGHKYITCQSDGTWSGGLPHCTNTSSSDLSNYTSEAAVLFSAAKLMNIAICIALFHLVKNIVQWVL